MTHPSVEPRLDGHSNMARDAALLERAERGGVYVRVYTWDGPWVSLGRFQRPERALRDHNAINWVVRPTGGKGVLHGHDVTVGFAANLRDLDISDDEARRISTVYRAATAPLISALCHAGVPADLAEKTLHTKSAGHTADCFAHVSPNDIVDPATGRKVCGCALRVTDTAVLLQASVPTTSPLVDPATVFDLPSQAQADLDLDLEALAGSLRTVLGSRHVQHVF
jgi:lipoate-protein ligase A